MDRIFIRQQFLTLRYKLVGTDAKRTLSFNEQVIADAKKYAEAHNISLSRLTEYLLSKITSKEYKNFEDFPISDWVSQVAEGEAHYQTRASTRKALKEGFYKSKK